MGIGAVVFLLLVFSFVLFACTFLAAGLLHRWFKPRNRFVRLGLRCAPLAVAAVPLVTFTVGMILKNNASPETSYRMVFDQAADSAVLQLRGEASASTDSQHVFLAFAASDDTLRRVLSTASFSTVMDSKDLVPLPIFPRDIPEWWQAAQCRSPSTYAAKKVRSWDKVVITNCQDDATIYVEAFWIQ